MGRKPSSDKLTPLVLEFYQTKDNQVLAQLMKKSEGLIWTVMKYYYMEYFPGVIQEEIVDECKSIILLRALQGFNPDKGRFSTYYTWKLKSYIRYKQQFFLNRKKLLEHSSLEQPLNSEGDSSVLADVLSKFDFNLKIRTQRKMLDIFEEGKVKRTYIYNNGI